MDRMYTIAAAPLAPGVTRVKGSDGSIWFIAHGLYDLFGLRPYNLLNLTQAWVTDAVEQAMCPGRLLKADGKPARVTTLVNEDGLRAVVTDLFVRAISREDCTAAELQPLRKVEAKLGWDPMEPAQVELVEEEDEPREGEEAEVLEGTVPPPPEESDDEEMGEEEGEEAGAEAKEPAAKRAKRPDGAWNDRAHLGPVDQPALEFMEVVLQHERRFANALRRAMARRPKEYRLRRVRPRAV